MLVYSFNALTDLNVTDAPACLHSCISQKVYHWFAFDGINVTNSSDEPSSDEEEDSTFLPQPHRSPRLPAASSSGQMSTFLSTTSTSTLSSITQTTGLQRGLSLSSLSTLPSALWRTLWVPPVSCYNGVFSLESPIRDCIYEVATSGAETELEVCGPNTTVMAKTFMTMLGHAVEARDFPDILTPERTFIV